MTYYFISFDQSKFSKFSDRFPALSEGSWITSEDEMNHVLSSEDEGRCFFIDLMKPDKKIEAWVLLIRESHPEDKIIYVTGDQKPQEMKSHQLSPVGGDAYISSQVSADNLQRILSGFQNELTNVRGNKLESSGINNVSEQFDLQSLMDLKNDKLSQELDRIFLEARTDQAQKPKFQSISNFAPAEDESGEDMSDKDEELSLDGMEELDISETPDLPEDADANDQGLDLSLDSDVSLELGEDMDLGTSSEEPMENLGELDLGSVDEFSLENTATGTTKEAASEDDALTLSDNEEDVGLEFDSLDSGDLSPDVKEKLAEIDAIMDEDSKVSVAIPEDLNLLEDAADLITNTGKASGEEEEADSLDFGGVDDSLAMEEKEDKHVQINLADEGFEIADMAPAENSEAIDSDLDQPLVSEDLDLGNLDFGSEPEPEEAKPVAAAKEERTSTKIRKKKELQESKEESRLIQVERPMGQELRDISGAYSAELERMQATLSNLRSDREELLARIQVMEEEKLLHNRQTLTMRAELDEKKIELSIVRKKLNEDISELKDRLRLEEERRLILEEKQRILREELEKSAHKNKIDVKKVQMHERELEQKLELLKADAETQIRNRDLKILELKRKIDAMEFDMESMQTQEKRTVESRFELEDKLEKAIKTLRGAISVLEDETDKGAALEALKKNMEM
jgi:hypothetical protein